MDERITEARLQELESRCTVRRTQIQGARVRNADHIGPDEYRYSTSWEPLKSPARWPAGTTAFVEFKIPGSVETDHDADTRVYLDFDGTGWEGLLRVDGHPYAGLDRNHTRVPIDRMIQTPNVDRRSTVEPLQCVAEFASVPRLYCEPELAREVSVLHGISVSWVDRELQSAFHDYAFAWRAVQSMRDGYRKSRIREALETALRHFDLTVNDDSFREMVKKSRVEFRAALASVEPDPEGVGVMLTGHSHIDVAWLWPLRETVRKCARTFSTACRLLEENDTYVFSCSQPQLYEYTKRYFPSLYEEIGSWVKSGRWVASGGMWVESDCNVPSGESLIRQVLHGSQFFQDEFGVRPTTCWLPDVFGYPATLPQILAGCGLTSFYTNKLHWQSSNPFPANLFWWEGTDGTRLLAHIPKLEHYYNGAPDPAQLLYAVDHFKQSDRYDEVMLPFGFGDGGGGPTETMVSDADRAANFPGLPRARMAGEDEYFFRVRDESPDLPVWRGELYLETHRGTFTSQAEAKRLNRRCETLLRQAELVQLRARLNGDANDGVRNARSAGPAELEQAWRDLLLLQFHDILPGSSIGMVYEESRETYHEIEVTAREAIEGAMRSLVASDSDTDGVVFNTLCRPRNDVLTIPIERRSGQVRIEWSTGQTSAAQWIPEDSAYLVEADSLAPLTFTGFRVEEVTEADASRMSVSSQHLENDGFRIELNADGEIVRLYDKHAKREVIAPNSVANKLQLFQDGPEGEAAWNVHDSFELREYVFDAAEVEVVENGPVRASVSVTKRRGKTVVRQRICIYRTLPRIDFITQVDWYERQTMLKAAFPVNVRADEATYEIQLGTVRRPTHVNTSWDQVKFEVPVHRWVDLSEYGYGVSLLNDSKYGCDVRGNILRLTLLRGPEYPDPDADLGTHQFTYSLYPHEGDWRSASTPLVAQELNEPVLYASAGSTSNTNDDPLLSIEGPALLSAAKIAEDGRGYIVRCYEPYGGRGTVRVGGLKGAISVEPCSHIEQPVDRQAGDVIVHSGTESGFSFDIEPHQIRSFRITPK